MMWDDVVKPNKTNVKYLDMIEYLLPTGSYFGLTMQEVHRIDPGYLFFLAMSNFGETSDIAKQYLSFVDGI